MKRPAAAILGTLALAAAIPAVAPASSVELFEIGNIGTTKPVSKPMCPSQPCEVLVHSTSYQTKVVSSNFFKASRRGRIVAWTVTLSKPSNAQVAYFRDSSSGDLGLGPAKAGITVLKPVKLPRASHRSFGYEVVGASPAVRVGGDFGRTATIPLEKTLLVQRGDVVALDVPTWAPALACEGTEKVVKEGKLRTACKASGNWAWRASRAKSVCSPERGLPPTDQAYYHGSVGEYECLYHGARLMYSATLMHIR